MIFDFLIYSFNSLRVRKTRTLLTMIGIFIGIAAVVSLISLGQGLEKAITEQFSEVGVDKLTIQAAETGFGPPGSTALKNLNEDDFNAIEKTKGIKVAAKRYIRGVEVEFKDKISYIIISSLPNDKEARDLVVNAINLDVVEGRLLKPSDGYKVLVGNNFHELERFPKKINVGDKLKINGYEFEVVGVLDKLGNPQFNEIFLINEDVLEEVLDIKEGESDIIVAQVDNVDNIDKISEDVKKALRKSRDVEKGKEDFSVQTPQQAIESYVAILDIVQVILIGIAAISLIVGGIGIMNTMYTAVLERTREIGVMKSIGAKNSDILSIFLIESGILGLVGGGIGVVLGISFSKLVEVGAGIGLGPGILLADISFKLIFGALAFSFLIGTLSGILPAKQAAELQPVDALRQ